jgi:hypothetical protein
VDDAPAEVFCLGGFSEPVAVFSTRYIELWADVRAVMANDTIGPDLIPRMAERLFFRLLAELSLSKNDPEFAACGILKSVMAGQGLIQAPNTLMSLEYEVIASPYMACWFYGLSHELGHFVSLERPGRRLVTIPDDWILSAIEAALSRFDLPSELRTEATSRVRSNPTGFLLGLETIRSESMADIFATSLLFETTTEIMHLVKDRSGNQDDRYKFNLLAFITEMVLSLNIVALLDRCRRVAILACTPAPTREEGVEALLHPVAVAARLLMVRSHLEMASSHYLFGEQPTPEHHQKASDMIDAVMEGLVPATQALERGLAQVVEFSLDRQRRPTFLHSIEDWRQVCSKDPVAAAIGSAEIERFCTLAQSLGKWASVFDMMLTVARNPSAEISIGSDKGTIYLCPWVAGPSDFNQPFGLMTKYGYLVFVFLEHGELFKLFLSDSAANLAEGYEMKSAALIAETTQQLRDAIALRLPPGRPFQLIIEGSEQFDGHMQELVNGTIWPNEGSAGTEDSQIGKQGTHS